MTTAEKIARRKLGLPDLAGGPGDDGDLLLQPAYVMQRLGQTKGGRSE